MRRRRRTVWLTGFARVADDEIGGEDVFRP
jgi:hypothetical protein